MMAAYGAYSQALAKAGVTVDGDRGARRQRQDRGIERALRRIATI